MEDLDNRNWEILKDETYYYSKLFMNMAVHLDFSHWFTWKIGWNQQPRQINLADWTNRILVASDLAVIAIALSLGDEDSSLYRISHQYFLLELWIIGHDDIENHAHRMMWRIKREHFTKTCVTHNIENAWKIILLIKAYEALQKERWECRLSDPEDRILLWYVVSMLWGEYELRPYMIDKTMEAESWVSFYDHLFEDFTIKSYNKYNTSWYWKIWNDFLDLRNDIARKKWLPVIRLPIPEPKIDYVVKKYVANALARISNS